MKDNRTLALAKRIKDETGKKLLNWEQSIHANSYRLSLGKGMVVIDLNSSIQNLPYYSFSVYNERNMPIDTLTADAGNPEYFNLLKELFEKVRGLFLKRDETYESMFDALDLPF